MSGNSGDRVKAATSLKAYGKMAVTALTELMVDPHYEVAANALISLQTIESRNPGDASSVLPDLVSLLTCNDAFRPEEVYLHAIQAAGVIGKSSKDKKLTARLKKELTCFAKAKKDVANTDPKRAAAEQALKRLANK